MVLISSMGQKLADAGINTLICVIVVFAVLIFISLVISLFSFIPKIEAKIAQKKIAKQEEQEIVAQGIDNAVSQIEAKEQESLIDDLELVAVISAAIAAATGSSTDDFVVRAIRKVRR